MDHETLLACQEDTGERLDKWLKAQFPEFSRTYFQWIIEEGAVLVNGDIVKKRTPLNLGDEVEVCFLLTEESSLTAEPIPLDILFEDEHLIAVNKPVGMVTHPAPGHSSGTFVNALLHHCRTLSVSPGDLRPGIVHRLDKDTSGVLIAAKHPLCHRKLVELFHSRSMKKTYIAICLGNPGESTIDAPIGRHPTRRKEMAVNWEHGKPAITLCRPLSLLVDGLTLVELRPSTGRTHQLRVHMKHRQTPILGDPVYGSQAANKKYGLDTQLLHALSLEFKHPLTGEELKLKAPIPESIRRMLPTFKDFMID